jgi:hypothetical protein
MFRSSSSAAKVCLENYIVEKNHDFASNFSIKKREKFERFFSLQF